MYLSNSLIAVITFAASVVATEAQRPNEFQVSTTETTESRRAKFYSMG
jgi:hypothetical protein